MSAMRNPDRAGELGEPGAVCMGKRLAPTPAVRDGDAGAGDPRGRARHRAGRKKNATGMGRPADG